MVLRLSRYDLVINVLLSLHALSFKWGHRGRIIGGFPACFLCHFLLDIPCAPQRWRLFNHSPNRGRCGCCFGICGSGTVCHAAGYWVLGEGRW